MNHRERVLAAIRHEVPDRVPVDVINIDNAGEVIDYLNLEKSSDWAVTEEKLYQTLSIDGRLGAPGYIGELPRDEQGNELSEWGCSLGNHHAGRHYPLADAAGIREIERYPWPDPDKYDYNGLRKWAEPLDTAGYAVRVRYWNPLFVRGMDLLGIDQMMILMMTEPAVYEAVVEKIFEINKAVFQRLIGTLGDTVQILAYGDDFATQRGMMISPELWRKFFKERWRELFNACHSAGKVVWFHSCGEITSVLPDLIDIGLDVWETVQLHTLPITPQKLKQEYGKHITFFGGINTQQMPFTTPEEISAEVRICIEALGKNGGYICGPDHHIPPETSPENTVALFQTASDYRKEGYTTIPSKIMAPRLTNNLTDT